MSNSSPTTSSENVEAALSLIDEAHAQDPTIAIVDGKDIPYELHYAQRCTYWLSKRAPDASDALRIAVRAQHFRRWEIPRSSYPMDKPGYLKWRTFLKRRQGDLCAAICTGCNIEAETCDYIASLIRKDNLKKNEDTQILEDVACLVFLDDQFEEFKKEHDEAKMVGILRKTWGKMSEKGHELALGMDLSEECGALVGKALAGGGAEGERGDVKVG